MKHPRVAKYRQCANPDCDIFKMGWKGFILSTAIFDDQKFCSLTCENPDYMSGEKRTRNKTQTSKEN